VIIVDAKQDSNKPISNQMIMMKMIFFGNKISKLRVIVEVVAEEENRVVTVEVGSSINVILNNMLFCTETYASTYL